MQTMRAYLFQAQRGKCHYCLVQMNMGIHGKFHCTKDHKIPRSRGGGDMVGNLVGACWTCNNMRGSIPYEAFKQYIQLYGNRRSINSVLRDLSREEYERHKGMWDKIHGARYSTVEEVPRPVETWKYRRPSTEVTRQLIRNIVLAFDFRERNLIWLYYMKGEKYETYDKSVHHKKAIRRKPDAWQRR